MTPNKWHTYIRLTLVLFLTAQAFGCLNNTKIQEFEKAPLIKPFALPDFPSETWSYIDTNEGSFSSPRAIDLNNDGTLDVIQGFGLEGSDIDLDRYVIAFDGRNGDVLWKLENRNDMVGTAIFEKFNNDATPDILMSGRDGELIAINGATGTLLWEFNKSTTYMGETGTWFNFYTSQTIPDQNDDNIPDVFTSSMFYCDNTVVCTFYSLVMVLSGADGSILSIDQTPDGESGSSVYMAPLVIPATTNKPISILFGTGGETHGGSLWLAPLSSIANNSISADAIALYTNTNNRGLIAAPSLVDLNQDDILDIVVQPFDGKIIAFDGDNLTELWNIENTGFETYTSPTIGYFTGNDDIPDIFATVNNGIFPFYDSADYLIIDGKNGSIVWRQTLGFFGASSASAVDLNGDGQDEILFGVNLGSEALPTAHQFYLLDTLKLELHKFGEEYSLSSLSAPWVGDLDGNGLIDFLFSVGSFSAIVGESALYRYEIDMPTPYKISWSGYFGTEGNGIFRP